VRFESSYHGDEPLLAAGDLRPIPLTIRNVTKNATKYEHRYQQAVGNTMAIFSPLAGNDKALLNDPNYSKE